MNFTVKTQKGLFSTILERDTSGDTIKIRICREETHVDALISPMLLRIDNISSSSMLICTRNGTGSLSQLEQHLEMLGGRVDGRAGVQLEDGERSVLLSSVGPDDNNNNIGTGKAAPELLRSCSRRPVGGSISEEDETKKETQPLLLSRTCGAMFDNSHPASSRYGSSVDMAKSFSCSNLDCADTNSANEADSNYVHVVNDVNKKYAVPSLYGPFLDRYECNTLGNYAPGRSACSHPKRDTAPIPPTRRLRADLRTNADRVSEHVQEPAERPKVAARLHLCKDFSTRAHSCSDLHTDDSTSKEGDIAAPIPPGRADARITMADTVSEHDEEPSERPRVAGRRRLRKDFSRAKSCSELCAVREEDDEAQGEESTKEEPSPGLLRRAASADDADLGVSRSTTTAPQLVLVPSALRIQPRCPIDLQRVILQSCRSGICDVPPKDPKLAMQVFDHKRASARTNTAPIQRQLSFGNTTTVLFRRKDPTNEGSCQIRRWSAQHKQENQQQQQASSSSSPGRAAAAAAAAESSLTMPKQPRRRSCED
jgi:hypothetical protein